MPIRARTEPLRDWLDFASALVRKNAIKGDVVTSLQHIGQRKQNRLRELWELTELSASAFADEVAGFYQLERIALPDMLAARALTSRFSRRFLREISAFPRVEEGRDETTIALCDPTETADESAAAELVLRAPVQIRIASFEGMTTALSERAGEEDAPATDVETSSPQLSDDIENLRDLASGAPVVRAVVPLKREMTHRWIGHLREAITHRSRSISASFSL